MPSSCNPHSAACVPVFEDFPMNGIKIVALFGSFFLAGCANTTQPPTPQIVDPAPVTQEATAPIRSPSAARSEAPPRASAVMTPSSETSASSPVRHQSAATSKAAPAWPAWDVSPPPSSADKKTIIKIQPKIVINVEPETDASHTGHRPGRSQHASKSGSSSGKTALVHGYYRKNGVYVRSHSRRSRSRR